MTFVSKPLVPQGGSYDTDVMSRGEPSLPPAFAFGDELIEIAGVRTTWRSTKTDRGDMYLKRHWFECACRDGRIATIYFDRGARRNQPRWWLYTIVKEGETDAP